jgi:hypothetical protein
MSGKISFYLHRWRVHKTAVATLRSCLYETVTIGPVKRCDDVLMRLSVEVERLESSIVD